METVIITGITVLVPRDEARDHGMAKVQTVVRTVIAGLKVARRTRVATSTARSIGIMLTAGCMVRTANMVRKTGMALPERARSMVTDPDTTGSMPRAVREDITVLAAAKRGDIWKL